MEFSSTFKDHMKKETLDDVGETLIRLQLSNESNSTHNSGGGCKRTAALSTIEGTPIAFKRLDTNPTPLHMSINNNLFPPTSISTSTIDTRSVLFPNETVAILTAMDKTIIHDTGSHHQENARRTNLLTGDHGCLFRPHVISSCYHIPLDRIKSAPLADLLRVHEYSYLNHIERKCHLASGGTYQDPLNPLHSTSLPYFYPTMDKLDNDTPLCGQSLSAAKLFCGAAIAAVDLVLGQSLSSTKDGSSVTEDSKNMKYTKAFVVGRPPGHHAGPMGCVVSEHHWSRPEMTSSGFCLLNTVAVAAAYARYKYSDRNRLSTVPTSISASIESPSSSTVTNSDKMKKPYTGLKISIVDIDIHHGNGTEEIVRHLRPHMRYLPLPSSYAPMGQLAYKPWLNEYDAQDVLFSSIHLYAGASFYPGTGKETAANDTENIINICLTPIGQDLNRHTKSTKLTPKQKKVLHESAKEELRRKVQSLLLPRLESFQADILFISAGFDAHIDDYYHFLEDEDFHWLTSQLCQTVHSTGGKVISILEGGYSLESPIVPETNVATTTTTTTTTTTSKSVRNTTRNGASKNRSSDEYNSFSSMQNDSSLKYTTTPTDISLNTKDVHVSVIVNSVSSVSHITAETPYATYKYSQYPGDGGLVKGVLAHVCALAGTESWAPEVRS